MPAHKTATQLHKFFRLVTYLSPFIASLSSFTTPLYGLLKKGTEFMWNNSYQEAFNKVKSVVCKDTTLWYFYVCMPVSVQVDAFQKGHPVAFASMALMPVEQHNANIECELLTCVFGAEWFHTYVFGCAFTVESANKPLEQINMSLADTPVHLQRMLLWLQTYDVTIKYQPGKRDAGCRCPLPLCTPQGTRHTCRHHHQPCAHHTWQENLSSRLSSKMTCSTAPLLRWSLRVGQTTSIMFNVLYALTMATETPSQLKMASSFEVKLSSFLCWKDRKSSKQYMNDIWKSASAKTEQDNVCISLESTQTSNASLDDTEYANITTCRNHDNCSSQHQPQNAHGNSLALTTSTLTDLNT